MFSIKYWLYCIILYIFNWLNYNKASQATIWTPIQIELNMKGGVNILRILNKVQIYGIAPTLTLFTSFDNSKDVQEPPELHIMFRGERQASVIEVEPMIPDEDDSQSHLTEHTQQETCEHLEAYSGVTVTAMAKSKY